MIKLGVNSVLFKTLDFPTAAKYIKEAGYDGVEISGIKGMCEHLNLDKWKQDKPMLQWVSNEYGLPFFSTEIASLDRDRLLTAFEACAEIGIPIINVGPGGKAGDEETLKQSIEHISNMAAEAEKFGVTLACKAHVGAAVYNTPTSLKLIEGVKSKAFGLDMDPSHVYRAGENPVDAIAQVVHAAKHIHIRDCVDHQGQLGGGPGTPKLQTCGRADIDLFGFIKALVKGEYDGPVCLEVIGPDLIPVSAAIIAAETRGYLNALLKIAYAEADTCCCECECDCDCCK
jgi:sugar phosphate isomerase/epimerase